MHCEKCNQERPKGRTYLFHYGRRGETSTGYNDQMQKVSSTSYSIAGQAGAAICDRCVARMQIFFVLVACLSPLLFLYAAYDAFMAGNTMNQVVCGGIGLLLLFIIPIYTLRSRQIIGERLAIQLKKKGLEEKKYNTFLTTSAYRRLKKG